MATIELDNLKVPKYYNNNILLFGDRIDGCSAGIFESD